MLDASKWTSGRNNNVQIINNRVRFNGVCARTCDVFTDATQYILSYKVYIQGIDRGCLSFANNTGPNRHPVEDGYAYLHDVGDVMFQYWYIDIENQSTVLKSLSTTDAHWYTGEHTVKYVRKDSKLDFYFDDMLIYENADFFEYSENSIGAWKWSSSYLELYDFTLELI